MAKEFPNAQLCAQFQEMRTCAFEFSRECLRISRRRLSVQARGNESLQRVPLLLLLHGVYGCQ